MPQLQERYFFQAEIKKIGRVQVKNTETGKYEDGVKVRGYASTNDLDRGNDVVLPEAFRKTIVRDYKRNPIILAQHDTNRPIGKATSMEIDSQGLLIEAIIYEDEYARLVDKEVLRTFSIGYFPTVVEYHDLETDRILDPTIEADFMQIWWDDGVKRIIKELELYEVSVVSLPMNQAATFSLAKSVKSFLKDNKEELRLQYHPSLNPSDMEKNRKNLLEAKEDEQNQEQEQQQEQPVEQPKPEAPQEGGESESTDEAEGAGEKPAAPAESTEGEDGEKSVQAKADEKSGEEDEEEGAEGEDDDAGEEEGEKPENGEEGEKPADDESKGVEIDPRLVTAKNVKTLMDAAKLLKADKKRLEERVAELEKQLDITPQKRAAANFQESSMPSKKDKEEEGKKQPKVEKAGFKAAFIQSAK